MTKIPCEIARDLFPSYIDGLTSKVSNEVLEEHLRTCEACREALDAMREEDPGQTEPAEDPSALSASGGTAGNGISVMTPYFSAAVRCGSLHCCEAWFERLIKVFTFVHSNISNIPKPCELREPRPVSYRNCITDGWACISNDA